MDYTKEELQQAHWQIASTVHKLRETVKTLETKAHPQRYTSQIKLAKRRIQAIALSNSLIQPDLPGRWT